DGFMIEQLREAFESACEKLECNLLEMNGEEDHVHLLMAYPPKLAISVMVNNLKSVSSRRIRRLNTHIPRQSKSAALWSRSYFACSAGGATIETLRVCRLYPRPIGRGFTRVLLKNSQSVRHNQCLTCGCTASRV